LRRCYLSETRDKWTFKIDTLELTWIIRNDASVRELLERKGFLFPKLEDDHYAMLEEFNNE